MSGDSSKGNEHTNLRRYLQNCMSVKEKFCSAAIKVGKKPWAVQFPLLKYKQFSSNINGKEIDFNED